MSEKDTEQSELARLMAENLTYVRSMAAMAAKSTAKIAIDTYEKARVYSMLNGEKTHYGISDDLKIPRETVRNWVGSFLGNGLAAVPNTYSKSNKALYTLDELGINLDSLRSKSKKDSTASNESGLADNKKQTGTESPDTSEK